MTEALQILTTAVIGIFAGSMLTEAILLVPYWRSMPAEDFFEATSHHARSPL